MQLAKGLGDTKQQQNNKETIMYTFCNYTQPELLESDGRTFWTTYDNKNMKGAIKVVNNSIYLLHNCGGIGAIGYNLSDEDKEGYMYDWCIYYDDRYYDEVDNREDYFKDFAVAKKSPVKKQQKKDFKLQVRQAGDKCIEVSAVDAKTEEHLRYLLFVTEEGIYRHNVARPNAEEYTVPKGMFDEDGRISVRAETE